MGKKHKHNNRNKNKHSPRKLRWADCITPQFDPDCPRCLNDDEVCELSDDKPIFYCLRCDVEFVCLNETETVLLSQLADSPPMWSNGEDITNEYKPSPLVEDIMEGPVINV